MERGCGPPRISTDPPHQRETPIDTASLFSAPEAVVHHTATGSRPPTTSPFLAPDYDESDSAAPAAPAAEPRTGA